MNFRSAGEGPALSAFSGVLAVVIGIVVMSVLLPLYDLTNAIG